MLLGEIQSWSFMGIKGLTSTNEDLEYNGNPLEARENANDQVEIGCSFRTWLV